MPLTCLGPRRAGGKKLWRRSSPISWLRGEEPAPGAPDLRLMAEAGTAGWARRLPWLSTRRPRPAPGQGHAARLRLRGLGPSAERASSRRFHATQLLGAQRRGGRHRKPRENQRQGTWLRLRERPRGGDLWAEPERVNARFTALLPPGPKGKDPPCPRPGEEDSELWAPWSSGRRGTNSRARSHTENREGIRRGRGRTRRLRAASRPRLRGLEAWNHGNRERSVAAAVC